jgi:hypothetical protein
MMVGFAYAMEFFIAWYGGNEYELYAFTNNRVPTWLDLLRRGAPLLVGLLVDDLLQRGQPAGLLVPQLRQNPAVIWIVALLVTIGMWFERFVIIVTSLHRAFLPGEWHMFFPTWVDIGIFVGTIGIFGTLFLLFVKFLPTFAMAELKAVMPQADPHGHGESYDPVYIEESDAEYAEHVREESGQGRGALR